MTRVGLLLLLLSERACRCECRLHVAWYCDGLNEWALIQRADRPSGRCAHSDGDHSGRARSWPLSSHSHHRQPPSQPPIHRLLDAMVSSRVCVAALLLLLSLMLFCTHPAVAADSNEDSPAAAEAAPAATGSASAAADVDEVEVDVESDHPVELPPAGAARAAADKGQVLNEEPIALARADFCKACYTVVEEFHKWTVQNFNNPNGHNGDRYSAVRNLGTASRANEMLTLCRRCCRSLLLSLLLHPCAARRNTTMTRGQLVEWFCRTGPFEHWKENLVWGCIVRSKQNKWTLRALPLLLLLLPLLAATRAADAVHARDMCPRLQTSMRSENRARPPRRRAGALLGHAHFAGVHDAGRRLQAQSRGQTGTGRSWAGNEAIGGSWRRSGVGSHRACNGHAAPWATLSAIMWLNRATDVCVCALSRSMALAMAARCVALQACALPSVDACDPWVSEGRPKTDCEACSRVANDIHWSLTREQKINASIVDRTLRVICMEVGMRHDRPMEAEAFCHEHVDEHWKEMIKMLVKVYNDPAVHDKARAVKKRFCGGMTEVCEPERAEWAAEVRAQKEEERAKRLAARKTKETKAKDEL